MIYQALQYFSLCFVLLLSIGFFYEADAVEKTCEVTIPTTLSGSPNFKLTGCEFAGHMKVVGPHYAGKFILDLHKLTSGSPEFDEKMKEYFQHRYTSLSIIPFDDGDKYFKALLRLNGVSKVVKVKVLSLTKESIKASFHIDLRKFNFKPGYAWEIIRPEIGIVARVYASTKEQDK